jgi:hypothetical protein
MSLNDIRKHNDLLQAEAQRLIDATRLDKLLTSFGRVELSGSFVYGTMVDRDIDIEVYLQPKDINIDTRAKVMNAILMLPQCVEMRMTDRKLYPKPHRPKGIWFGPYMLFEDNIWNIDIWLTPLDELNTGLHEKMLSITPEQRDAILIIKQQALENGIKKKGITSAEIYKSVLSDGVSNYQEFIDHKSGTP